MNLKQTVILAVLIVGCFLSVPADAASREVIDAKVSAALKELYEKSQAARDLSAKASGILVFPSVIKAGIGIGGEYGEGSLLVGGNPVGYYNVAAASIGFQLGAQSKTQVIMFMTDASLKQFRDSNGWEAGVDGSVALVEWGAGGSVDTNNIKDPVVGFIYSNKGLMYNLTLEGSKISPIEK
jgi:lipid-binding SYLF domain-containing protein